MKKLMFICGIAVVAAALVGANAYGSANTVRKASLTIIHVQKGCHVFSSSTGKAATVKRTIARGGSVTIRNQDIDGHKLVQTRGPVKLSLRALKMNDRAVLRFTKSGIYAFTTKTFELAGMPETMTMGMDNTLRLTVVVK